MIGHLRESRLSSSSSASSGNADPGPDPAPEVEKRRLALRPRDAATLVLIDRTGANPRVLMGKRRAGLVFLPNKYVFPGGRVDLCDRRVEAADDLDPVEVEKLLLDMKGRPTAARARALAMAAIRESFEEAGLVIGSKAPGTATAGLGAWTAFCARGFRPSMSKLAFFARAITPPGRPRRYDTRFFTVDARHIAEATDQIDGELERLDWFTFDEVRRLDVPSITRAVVEDLADRLDLGASQQRLADVPFYYFKGGTFHRTRLKVPAAGPA